MTIDNEFTEVFNQIMDSLDQNYEYMQIYDSMPHEYGDSVLYQVESHTVEMIGLNPGITATELSIRMGKTASACSQIIRKLKKKELVFQKRNENNSREYNLFLTEHGWKIYYAHALVDKQCGERKKESLSKFSLEELKTYLKINQVINQEFEIDVKQAETVFESLEIEE